MVAEEVIITLSGGAPWGFRLQGGVEHQKPLQVAKVRKRSKACRAGLREADELVSINEQPCGTLSHAQAMNLIDSSPGILHIRVKRAPAGFQSVVLVTRAPSPRIDKEYRAALRAMSPTHPHHAPVREVHRSHSSLTSGLTSPPGSEAYYGETDSDADVAGYERQRRQKRRSPSNSNPGKPTGRASPEGGETSEMSGYDSAPDAQVYTTMVDGQADDQGPRDGGQEEDSGFLEPANVPLVSPERAKEALMLSSRSQLVPMVGPVNKPIDEELTTTYMEKAKQAKLNRGDTVQDKQVKEAKSKCRTIASLLTDAPNPHSKGVLMFKKRRQRSKKYTLTSFGSVDEDRPHDSQEEEDGVFPGSESEFDEDGFSSAPDPTWDSDYLDMLEKRATAGSEGRGDAAEDAPSPGLSDTAGKGAQLFEQQRKRAAEHAKKMETMQLQAPQKSQVQEQAQTYQLHPEMQPNVQSQQTILLGQELSQVSGPIAVGTHGVSSGYSAVSTARIEMSPPPAAPKPATASVTILTSPTSTAETPLPELPASNVLNRTARPFTPGFISIKAATAPVTFRPPVTKTAHSPASAAVVPPPFSTAAELAINTASVSSQLPPGPPLVLTPPSAVLQGPLVLTQEAPDVFYPPVISTSVETVQPSTPITTVPFTTVPPVPMPSVPPVPQAPMATVTVPPVSLIPGSLDPVAPVPPLQLPAAQPPVRQFSTAHVSQAPVVSQPEAVAPAHVPVPTSRTGILLEARRRSGKPKPMFNVPDVKKNSPNPELLSMVQNLDDRSTRHKYSQPLNEAFHGATEQDRNVETNVGRMPPPVAPKPRVIHESPQILQTGGKGAQLFARRQNRMGMYVVDTPSESPYQREVATHSTPESFNPSLSPSLPPQFKYSPNVRAPPPIGYNPLLAPSIPTGPQRNTSKPDNKGRRGQQKEGIKALDFMRRQPYQLNSAMFNYGGSATNLSAIPSYQVQRQQHGDYTTMVGSSLTSPKQVPVKTARVYEIKRFSTPTPMSAPTLAPKVIAPRSATTLGERLTHSSMTSPPPAAFLPSPIPVLTSAPFSAQTSASPPSQTAGLPTLPKFSTIPIPNPMLLATPTLYNPVSYTAGLQTAKQFQSAPELNILASLPPVKSNPIQAPKPRFVATRGGVQPHVWRPGAM
ncbi:synaptopodin 2-like protein isoform X2 [Mastacembelus armatus]|uniref:synaptopodin 2-like protein isoform X2 n=1 Tax=Mastacembelus armatus TaxID=205130 RepID=UPI000F37F013|nr:synaptopodin 2-like protein isoform X2 [Mastacembelus armatus]